MRRLPTSAVRLQCTRLRVAEKTVETANFDPENMIVARSAVRPPLEAVRIFELELAEIRVEVDDAVGESEVKCGNVPGPIRESMMPRNEELSGLVSNPNMVGDVLMNFPKT